MNIHDKLNEMAEEHSKDPYVGWAKNTAFHSYRIGFRAALEMPEVKALVAAIERRMKSDDACELPFDENLGEALNGWNKFCTPKEGE